VADNYTSALVLYVQMLQKKQCIVAILGIKTSKQYLWWCEVLNEKQSTGKIAIANLNRGFSNGPKNTAQVQHR